MSSNIHSDIPNGAYLYDDFEDDEDEAMEVDLHAKSRDKKMKRRGIDKMMRGNRSVFTIKETKQRRDKRLIDEE